MSLNLLVFLGSARASTPPHPARLGLRVARACVAQLQEAGHTVTLIDPLDVPLDPVFTPHFAFAADKAPAPLQALAQQIAAADGYVMVSPEYNHSMSPALSNLLNHFASSLFAFKPSAIVTYSAGQWGGARAAMGMRTYLSELGCLPVSAMVHLAKAQDVFTDAGGYGEGVDTQAWHGFLGRCFSQLEWWGRAAQAQRAASGGQAPTPAFGRTPSQRNAP
jgi:NAD(P)H-dependent FMN reductase